MATDDKDKIRELNKTLENLRNEYKNLERENKDLKKLETEIATKQKELDAQNVTVVTLKNTMKTLQDQVKDLEKANGELSKTAEPNAKDLKEQLKTKEEELSLAKKEIGIVRKEIAGLHEKNAKLTTDESINAAMADANKSQQKDIERLTAENERLSKKVAKTEGDFPKLPVPEGGIKSIDPYIKVQMTEKKRMDSYKIVPKDGSASVIMQIFKTSDGAEDVRFVALI